MLPEDMYTALITIGQPLPTDSSLEFEIPAQPKRILDEVIPERFFWGYYENNTANVVWTVREIINETVLLEEKPRKKITPKQAYQLALKVAEDFDKKWSSYVEEDARFMSLLDDEGD